MMETKKISYSYDPKRMHFIIYEGEKLRGGFKGNVAERQFARLLQNEAADKSIINLTDMSESVRKAKVRRLRALWIKQGIDDMRDAIIEPYGVTSTADLTEQQLDELIARFSPNAPPSELVRRLRSHCLSLMTRLGIYVDGDSWKNVNAFMMNPRIAGKMLYQCNAEELENLRRKLNSILDKQEKEARWLEENTNYQMN